MDPSESRHWEQFPSRVLSKCRRRLSQRYHPLKNLACKRAFEVSKRVPIAGSPKWMRIGQRHERWMEVWQGREYRTVATKFFLPEVDNPGFDKCLGSINKTQ